MNSTERVSVTIGIPTYSRLHYLKESTSSALAQTYPHLEILISQNPHPDPVVRKRIEGYCRELADNDFRVRYQLLPRDVGPPANFNAIADAASGEFLMMIGDDDRFMPNAIEDMVSTVGDETVLVFGKRHMIDAAGKRFKLKLEPQSGWVEAQDRVPAGRLANSELWAWQQAMGTETSLIRTRNFRRIRFRENIDMCDVEFFILLAREQGEFIFVPEYVTEYRYHPDSTTGRQFVNYRELVDVLMPLTVSEELEPHKARLLGSLMISAVTSCLAGGLVNDARRFLQSPYLPRKMVLTRLCAALPAKLAAPVYKTYCLIRHGQLPRPAAAA
jgi:glycosyltransferase involved in cell wall biosynthesis